MSLTDWMGVKSFSVHLAMWAFAKVPTIRVRPKSTLLSCFIRFSPSKSVTMVTWVTVAALVAKVTTLPRTNACPLRHAKRYGEKGTNDR